MIRRTGTPAPWPKPSLAPPSIRDLDKAHARLREWRERNEQHRPQPATGRFG